ncbi:DUF7823 domain-containing protein [Xenorhabdus szentirmaii]
MKFPYFAKETYDKVATLFNQHDLQVTVDGKTYNLGRSLGWSVIQDPDALLYYNWYYISAEFGDILKQAGKTKRFCFKWL